MRLDYGGPRGETPRANGVGSFFVVALVNEFVCTSSIGPARRERGKRVRSCMKLFVIVLCVFVFVWVWVWVFYRKCGVLFTPVQRVRHFWTRGREDVERSRPPQLLCFFIYFYGWYASNYKARSPGTRRRLAAGLSFRAVGEILPSGRLVYC